MNAVLTPPSPALEPEYVLSDAEFERVRVLIHQRAGISLHRGKQAMVYSRLARRLRETGQPSFGEYLRWLEQHPEAHAEWEQFINALTTNLTSFFREAHHFELLRDALAARAGRPMRIWCNAASTGEEPYSLAITALDTLGPAAPVQILATDIDTKVLATARAGVYPADSRGLAPEQLRRHFLRGTGPNQGHVRVKRELAERIQFRAFNLMAADWSGLGEPFDFIFCRNVMIYFDHPTQRRVLERMHRVLRRDGLLFVGHSENFTDAHDLFRLRGKTVYEPV